jgi:hypothetical protein
MVVWWLLGGIGSLVVGLVLYREWRVRRGPSSSHSVMTKTTDGEPLQFLVRPTRKR